jgi:CAAX protease family protein
LVRFQADRTPLQSTLILAPAVALWHVPLVFLASENLAPILLVGTIAVTFFYTWLFNRAGGSVLVTIVAHAAEGTITLSAFGFVGVDDSRLPWLYNAVWCAVVIGLLVFDWQFWHGRARAAVDRVHPVPAPGTA